jgi:hypothetical protein
VAEIVFLGNYPPIGFELLTSAGFVDGRVADAVAGECAAGDDEVVAELEEDDGFGVGICFAEPEEMSAEGVHFGGERGADEVDVLDLGEGVPTYLGVYSRLFRRHQGTILIMRCDGRLFDNLEFLWFIRSIMKIIQRYSTFARWTVLMCS